MSLTHIHRRLVHSTYAVSLKSLLSLAPGYTLNNLYRDRRLQVWPLRHMGDLHSRDIIAGIILGTSVSFLIIVTQVHLPHLAELCPF